jgi:hypothetical protein
VKHAAICYHQHHPIVPRGTAGTERCQVLADGGSARCEHGLDGHR